jgi:hypothetical protein
MLAFQPVRERAEQAMLEHPAFRFIIARDIKSKKKGAKAYCAVENRGVVFDRQNTPGSTVPKCLYEEIQPGTHCNIPIDLECERSKLLPS